jgi:hypothetical protein
MKPNFLIIGAAKSGTTALWSFVRQHPDVFMPAVKEPQYFAFAEGERPTFGGPGATIGRAITSRVGYEALFADAGDARAVGEASNLYLYREQAPARIAGELPDVRLIAILRQPAERAFSSYQHLKRQGREPAPDFASALALEAERIREGWGFLWRYRDLGFYGRQLGRYLDRFPRERVLVHLYEDLQEAPEATLRRTFEFLGVDPDFSPDLTARPNRGGVPRTGWRGALLSRRNPARRLLAPLIPARMRPGARAAADSRALAREVLDLPMRRRLTDEFSADIRELAWGRGRDQGPWGFDGE